MEAPPVADESAVTPEFISNKRALDQFLFELFNKQFHYKIGGLQKEPPSPTTIIKALTMLRIDPFGFDFIDVIQKYVELLRQDVYIDENLLRDLKHLINHFKELLEPWVDAQTPLFGNRQQMLKDKNLATVLKDECKKKLSSITKSENPSENFMHEMVVKLCDFFNERLSRKPERNINDEVHLGSTLYSMLLYYDQLLLPILEELKTISQTSDGKKMIKVFDPHKHVYVKGGRRTRHKKRNGNKKHSRSKRRSRSRRH